jgi:hypothetical protein
MVQSYPAQHIAGENTEKLYFFCHCEERSDEAIPLLIDCHAIPQIAGWLAMTALLSHCEKRRDKAISQVAGLPRVDFVNPRNDKNM